MKNGWRSAEELRKFRDTMIDHRCSFGCSHCDCREREFARECCFQKVLDFHTISDPKCNIQKESYMLKQPLRQVNMILCFGFEHKITFPFRHLHH